LCPGWRPESCALLQLAPPYSAYVKQTSNVQRPTSNVQRPTSNSETAQAKKRSGESIVFGLQIRATQCSQLSWPLRISISTRRKYIGTSTFVRRGTRTASFSV